MADTFVNVKGLDEFRRVMLQFPKEMDEKLLQSAMLPAAKLVRDEARRRAPVLKVPSKYRLAGVLARNIRMARSKPRPGMSATVIIGVRKLSKSFIRRFKQAAYRRGKTIKGADIVGNPFYWRFMEFGYTDRGGKWHGPHGGNGFLRPAFEANKMQAIEVMVKETGKRVDKVAKKLGLRTKRDFYG